MSSVLIMFCNALCQHWQYIKINVTVLKKYINLVRANIIFIFNFHSWKKKNTLTFLLNNPY